MTDLSTLKMLMAEIESVEQSRQLLSSGDPLKFEIANRIDLLKAQLYGDLFNAAPELIADAERLRYLLNRNQNARVSEHSESVHIALYDPVEGEWNILEDDEAVAVIDAAIAKEQA